MTPFYRLLAEARESVQRGTPGATAYLAGLLDAQRAILAGPIRHHLEDAADDEAIHSVTVHLNRTFVEVALDGFSDRFGGAPIVIEFMEGVPRVIVWADDSQEDYTHLITLEGCRDKETT